VINVYVFSLLCVCSYNKEMLLNKQNLIPVCGLYVIRQGSIIHVTEST
jgi:hypothetical protein